MSSTDEDSAGPSMKYVLRTGLTTILPNTGKCVKDSLIEGRISLAPDNSPQSSSLEDVPQFERTTVLACAKSPSMSVKQLMEGFDGNRGKYGHQSKVKGRQRKCVKSLASSVVGQAGTASCQQQDSTSSPIQMQTLRMRATPSFAQLKGGCAVDGDHRALCRGESTPDLGLRTHQGCAAQCPPGPRAIPWTPALAEVGPASASSIPSLFKSASGAGCCPVKGASCLGSDCHHLLGPGPAHLPSKKPGPLFMGGNRSSATETEGRLQCEENSAAPVQGRHMDSRSPPLLSPTKHTQDDRQCIGLSRGARRASIPQQSPLAQLLLSPQSAQTPVAFQNLFGHPHEVHTAGMSVQKGGSSLFRPLETASTSKAALLAQRQAHVNFLANLPRKDIDGLPSPESKRSRKDGLVRQLHSAQARISHSRQLALRFSAQEVKARDHLLCTINATPFYEGHLVKLFCSIVHVHQTACSEADYTPAGLQGTAVGQPNSGQGSIETKSEAYSAFVFLQKSAVSDLSLQSGKHFIVLQPWHEAIVDNGLILLVHLAVAYQA